MPERIQQKRTKGWRKPPGAVSVARPSKWGNPWRVWRDSRLDRWICQRDGSAHSERFSSKRDAIDASVAHFRAVAKAKFDVSELRGKDLMCFCPLDQPCHADVLLKLANEGA